MSAKQVVKINVQKNAVKPKAKPRGKPFKPGNPWAVKPGEVRNPGGRPKLLSEAYREWLNAEDESGLTNAARVALAVGQQAIKGEIQSVKEVRQATEGERIRTWRDDVIDLLREGKVTADDVRTEFGADEAEPLIVAAGIRRDEGGQAAGEGGEAGSSGQS